MADEQKASFAIELKDDVSSGALLAADALTKLQDQLGKDTKALADMQKAMRQLKGATTADVKAPLEALTKRIEEQKNKIASAQGAYVALGGKFGSTGAKASGFKARLAELQQATVSMPGPIGSVTSKLSAYVGGMSAAQATTLALGAAFLTTAAAAAVFTKSLFDEALAAGDARRNELLHFEALTKVRNMLGVAPGKADALQQSVDKVSASVSIGREKVASFAGQLYQSGLRGAALETALEGASVKASALGDAAGTSFAGFAASVALGGGSVKRLADDVKNRFGGIVQRQMSSLEVQQRKQRENWASLFRGVNVEPVLNAMKSLRDILNINTAAGQSLKLLLGGLLKPLMGAAETGLVFMRRFFKQMLIGALELKIAYQEVRNWFARTFGKGQATQAKDLLDRIQLGRVTVYALAAAFGVLAVNVIAATAPFLAAAAGVYFLYGAITGLYDLWNEIDWSGLGESLWKGIVNGLKSGWEAVKTVFSDLAGEAANAFKQALGIQSPSKVFAELGYQLPAGVAQGIKQGAPQAQQAAADMVQTPRLGAGTQTSAAPDGGATTTNTRATNTKSISIGELHIHAESSNPKALATAFRRELESVLEGVAFELGAPPMGAAP